MKILTEYKSTLEPKTLEAESTYGITIRNFYPGEAVGIYLRELYPSTISLIESLLYFKHNITLKYQGKQYKLDSLDDWKYTYQDPNDQIKVKTDRHVIYQAYLEQQKEYKLARLDKARMNLFKRYYELNPELEAMSDDRIVTYLEELAPLYEVDYDQNDRLSLIVSYIQVNYYINHDFDYSRPAGDIQVYQIGDMQLLSDLVWKCQNSVKPVDRIIEEMLQ